MMGNLNCKSQLIIKSCDVMFGVSFRVHQGGMPWRAQVHPSMTTSFELSTRVAYVGPHNTCTNKTACA